MVWKKDRLTDPEYLMSMRRPAFIASRAVSLSTQRLMFIQPRWLFLDLVGSVKELIATRPGIPSITLPQNLGDDTVGPTIIQELVPPEARKRAKKMPTIEKRISRSLKKLLGG